MKKEVCGLCNNEIIIGEPRFSFPILPEWHCLSEYKGDYHISCLKRNSEISSNLAHTYYHYYKDRGEIVKRESNVIIRIELDTQNIVFHSFDDFVRFYIPQRLICSVENMKGYDKLWLDIYKVKSISLDDISNLFLYDRIGNFTVRIEAFNYQDLIKMINEILMLK